MQIWEKNTPPPYVVDYYTNILKVKDCPPGPVFGGDKLTLRFHDKNRDNFMKLAEEALKAKFWT